MTPSRKLLKGTAFTGDVFFAPRSGEPDNLVGYTAVSKVQDAVGNKHTADVCVVSEDGFSIRVEFHGDTTKEFARGPAKWNIFFQFGDDTSTAFSTGIFEFEVAENPSL